MLGWVPPVEGHHGRMGTPLVVGASLQTVPDETQSERPACGCTHQSASGVEVTDLRIVPVTLKIAKAFVKDNHRHNKGVTGWKFGVGLMMGGRLVGVATAGRPVARHLNDGFTLEVNRTCTDGTPNANSMLYGAVWRAAKAMGYTKCITYTQADEPGTSLKAAGWVKVADLPPRKGWADSGVKLKNTRDPVGNGGVARQRWEIRSGRLH